MLLSFVYLSPPQTRKCSLKESLFCSLLKRHLRNKPPKRKKEIQEGKNQLLPWLWAQGSFCKPAGHGCFLSERVCTVFRPEMMDRVPESFGLRRRLICDKRCCFSFSFINNSGKEPRGWAPDIAARILREDAEGS